MWGINRADIQPLLSATHCLVQEMLEWAEATAPLTSLLTKAEVIELAKKAPGALGFVARKTKLKVYMADLASSSHLPAIKIDYERITSDYLGFLDAGATYILDGEAKALAERVFKFLYNNLLESQRFWARYGPQGREALTKQTFRREFGHIWSSCPYCDMALIGTPLLSTTDHFLAQDHFPVLSVYWENLIVSCHACNVAVKKAAFIGTKNGQSTSVPIFHPLFHTPAQHLVFEFADDWTPLEPRVTSTDPNDATRAQHYRDLFRLGELYACLGETLRREVDELLANVKTEYKRKAKTQADHRLLLTRVLRKHARRGKARALAGIGRVARTKVRYDLYSCLQGEVDRVARMLRLSV